MLMKAMKADVDTPEETTHFCKVVGKLLHIMR